MTALTDLTWQQLAAQLPANSVTVVSGKVTIDVSVAADITADALTDQGVIKFFSFLFTAANKAQVAANTTQAQGEKLAAFNAATIGSNADGYITLTRPFVCKSELATATNIIGTNA